MKVIHIVGRQNHGKTTLVVELVRVMTARGVRVGTIKHSSHHHEIDTHGKDSYRHREAGGSPASIVTPDLATVFVPRTPGDDAHRRILALYAGCDLVLIEGGIDLQGPKVEVWRGEVGGPLLANERDDVIAVVSDGRPEVKVPVWPRADICAVVDLLLARAREP